MPPTTNIARWSYLCETPVRRIPSGFDNNLSPSLVRCFAEVFPNSAHCVDAGLSEGSDLAVWTFAKDNGFTLVTKDSDFNALMTLRGFPPRVIWIRRANCSTKEIEHLLRQNIPLLHSFETQNADGLLILL